MKNKRIRTVFSISLTIFMLIYSSVAFAASPYSTTNVAGGPGTIDSSSYAKTGSIFVSDSIKLISSENSYFHIEYTVTSSGKLKRGYVPKSSIKYTSSELPPNVSYLKSNVTISNSAPSTTTTYSGPSSSYEKMGSVNRNEKVVLLGNKGASYSFIEYNTNSGKKRGYVASSYISSSSQTEDIAISSIIGPIYPINSYTNKNWKNYIKVPYSNQCSRSWNITVQGKNLNKVSKAELKDGTATLKNYSVSIINNKDSSNLVLSIKATSLNESRPAPFNGGTNVKLVLNDTVSKSVCLIPSFAEGTLSYGQCTWYAFYIARINNGQAKVSYADGVAISGNPSSAGFPKAKSALMVGGDHAIYLDSIKSSNNNGTTTYTLFCSDTNVQYRDGTISYYTATMVVDKNNKIIKYPIDTKDRKITKVKQ